MFDVLGISNRLQNQVDEVVDIMQTNIGKVMDRGEKLEDLQDKSGLCMSWIVLFICSNADLFNVLAFLKMVLAMNRVLRNAWHKAYLVKRKA